MENVLRLYADGVDMSFPFVNGTKVRDILQLAGLAVPAGARLLRGSKPANPTDLLEPGDTVVISPRVANG